RAYFAISPAGVSASLASWWTFGSNASLLISTTRPLNLSLSLKTTLTVSQADIGTPFGNETGGRRPVARRPPQRAADQTSMRTQPMFGLSVRTPNRASTPLYCLALAPSVHRRARTDRPDCSSVAENTSMPGRLSGSTAIARQKASRWKARDTSLLRPDPAVRVIETTWVDVWATFSAG